MKKLILTICLGCLSLHIMAQEILVETLFFESSKSQLTIKSKEQLNQFIKQIKLKEISVVSIVGHTDCQGSDAYNIALSKERASTVLNYLQSNVSDFKPIEITYKGELQPKEKNTSELGKQQNRRVEICYIKNEFHLPTGFEMPFTHFEINMNKDTTIVVNAKGTKIHVPKNAFNCGVNSNSNQTLDLMFREYTNSAEMAFSGIKMTYKANNFEYHFNSAGMFEIQGTYGGKPVELCKGKQLTVDYAIARQVKDMAFFSLNKTSNEWKMEQEMLPNRPMQIREKVKKAPINENAGGGSGKKRHCPLLRWVGGANANNEIVQASIDTVKFHGDEPNDNKKGLFANNGRTATLLASGADVGHTYPDIIRGLNVPSFGVYNCDQIYQLPKVVNVLARYKDQDGKLISNPYLVSLIDLDFNGAFSFSAKSFSCNPKGNNALAMFTRTGDLYLLKQEDFAKMKVENDGVYTFLVTKANDTIKNSKDLATYFGIKL
ncbi:MAG: OmpA family protein [bacterium]|nr:OmpA family protein [bacterium]